MNSVPLTVWPIVASLILLVAALPLHGEEAPEQRDLDRAAAWRRDTEAGDAALKAVRLNEAMRCYTSALKTAEGWGLADPRRGMSLRDLGRVHLALRQHPEAEDHLRLAAAVFEEAGSAQQHNLSATLEVFAALYSAQGRPDMAQPVLERALEIEENRLGADHPSLISILHQLASVYRYQLKPDKEDASYRRALAIAEKTWGPESIGMAQVLNDVANGYLFRNQFDKAVPLEERSLAITKKVDGPLSRRAIRSMIHLASLYMQQGKLEQAEPLFKQAWPMAERLNGPDHSYPDVLPCLNGLAQIYTSQGKYDQAEPLYKQSLALCETKMGKDSSEVVEVLTGYAGMLQAAGREAEAKPLLEQAKRVNPHVVNPRPPTSSPRPNVRQGEEQK